MRKNNIMIDFVVAWVDDSDKLWIKKKNSFLNKDDASIIGDYSAARYRDWGFFKYWFRSVEKNAQWVNKIYLVVDEQIPSFIDVNNPKLVIVNHSDFIPHEYLPTFSANAIEINFHRIKGLSDFFVYFNDDMFINKKIKPSYFFKNKLPKYCYIERKRSNEDLSYMGKITKNDLDIVNRTLNRKNILNQPFKCFNLRYGKYMLKNLTMINKKKFEQFEDDHLPCPFLKSTFIDVWNYANNECIKTSLNKFRSEQDVNQYLFKYFDLARGHFYPKKVKHGGYYLLNMDSWLNASKDITMSKNSLICLNDNSNVSNNDFLFIKTKLTEVFDKKYPNKCSFEK